MSKQADRPDYEYWRELRECWRHAAILMAFIFSDDRASSHVRLLWDLQYKKEIRLPKKDMSCKIIASKALTEPAVSIDRRQERVEKIRE